MPVDDRGLGYGSETPRKLEHFSQLVQVHLKVVQAIQAKNPWASKHYFYCDLTAGPGEVMGMAGSPLLFIEEANALGIAWQAAFCEKHPETALELNHRLRSLSPEILMDGNGYQVFPCDHSVCLTDIAAMAEELRKPVYGLIYADPTGKVLPFEAIRLLTQDRLFRFVDVLCYVAATTHKRVRKALPGHLTLRQELEGLGKRYIFARQPSTQHQWAFVFLTNCPGYPEMKKIGVYDINSQPGAAIIDRLDRTTEERGGQGDLGI